MMSFDPKQQPYTVIAESKVADFEFDVVQKKKLGATTKSVDPAMKS